MCTERLGAPPRWDCKISGVIPEVEGIPVVAGMGSFTAIAGWAADVPAELLT
jgi:hypothetical protein